MNVPVKLTGRSAAALAKALTRPRAKVKRQAKAPGPREGALLRDVLAYLAGCERAGVGKFWRANAGRVKGVRLAPPGTADVIGCLCPVRCRPGGRFFACELKRPQGGKLSDAQREWQQAMRDLGALVISEARGTRDVYDVLRQEGYPVSPPDVRLL